MCTPEPHNIEYFCLQVWLTKISLKDVGPTLYSIEFGILKLLKPVMASKGVFRCERLHEVAGADAVNRLLRGRHAGPRADERHHGLRRRLQRLRVGRGHCHES